jgi:hypothetical protein
MTDEVETGAVAGTSQGNAGAGAGNVGYGAQAGTGGAAAGTTNVSRDDIESIVNSVMNSLATSRAFQQSENVIDVGSDEAQMRGIVKDSHEWAANSKRTYDEYQDLSLDVARRNHEYYSRSRDHYDATQADNRAHIANLRKIELELLQNGNTAAKVGDASLWTTDKEALEAAVAAGVARAIVEGKQP